MMRENVRKSVIWAILSLVIGSYVYLMLTAPAQPANPDIGLREPWTTIIRVTLIGPYLLAWAFGAFAVDYLLRASKHAPDAKKTRAFRLLGFGVMALVTGSWITSLLGRVKTNFFHDPSFDMAMTVMQNYAYVLFPLVAYAFIYSASKGRAASARKSENAPVALLLTAVLGALWMAIIFTNEARQATTPGGGQPTYYISDALIMLTIITPTFVSWVMGIMGALNLSDMESGGTSTIRKSSGLIINGLLLAIFNSMILNGLLAAGGERLLGVGIGFLVAILYVFILLAFLSYWMIYRGAKALVGTPPYEPQK